MKTGRPASQKAIDMEPDSITIYQMELPYQHDDQQRRAQGPGQFNQPLATWATKRRWVQQAFARLQAAGYHIASAYTAVRNPSNTRFVYTRTDCGRVRTCWRLASPPSATSVACTFRIWIHGKLTTDAVQRRPIAPQPRLSADGRRKDDSGVHPAAEAGLASSRHISKTSMMPGYLERFSPQLQSLSEEGYLGEANEEIVSLSREGLLRVDSLLPRFFLPQHTGIRYT